MKKLTIVFLLTLVLMMTACSSEEVQVEEIEQTNEQVQKEENQENPTHDNARIDEGIAEKTGERTGKKNENGTRDTSKSSDHE